MLEALEARRLVERPHQALVDLLGVRGEVGDPRTGLFEPLGGRQSLGDRLEGRRVAVQTTAREALILEALHAHLEGERVVLTVGDGARAEPTAGGELVDLLAGADPPRHDAREELLLVLGLLVGRDGRDEPGHGQLGGGGRRHGGRLRARRRGGEQEDGDEVDGTHAIPPFYVFGHPRRPGLCHGRRSAP